MCVCATLGRHGSTALGVAASQQSVYVGLSVSAFVVCYAIASPICGQLVLSQPAFRILGIGLSIWVAALLLSGLAYFAGDAPGADSACHWHARSIADSASASLAPQAARSASKRSNSAAENMSGAVADSTQVLSANSGRLASG